MYLSEKIVVIGTNNFLANELINLINDPKKIIGFYNKNIDKLNTSVEQINIQNFKTVNPDIISKVIIISASIPESNNINRQNLFDVNIQLVEEICSHFTKSRIIFCSSVAVYGSPLGIINEKSHFNNVSEYGISKLWAEEIIKKCPKYAIVRISSMYGIGMKLNTIIPKIILSYLDNNKIVLYGKGERLQNYIHVHDVARYIYSASDVNDNNIYLAVNKKSYSNNELASIISQNKPNIVSNRFEDDSPSYIYNNDFTNKILNCTPNIVFEKSILELIEWLKKIY